MRISCTLGKVGSGLRGDGSQKVSEDVDVTLFKRKYERHVKI